MYSDEDYNSNDGMMTYVWGPVKWHYLHTLSFNYPVKPTDEQKEAYKIEILNMTNTLPCGACRENLKKNLLKHPLLKKHLKNRETFSRWVYDLHELVNKMLGKKSGLSYQQVRDRYEGFRARCGSPPARKNLKKENGCTNPYPGYVKSKCVIKIVPRSSKCDTFQIDKKCKL